MAFNWVTTPQIPSPNLPEPSVPSDTSYKVDVVANTVDWGGELRYNTNTEAYDVVYEFESLNINVSLINTATFGNATINVLTAINATGNTVSLNLSNIGNLTIGYGTTPNTPLSNLSVVNKEYVDNAVASISTGSGFDTTANLFVALGDLLVGVSPNTAVRLPVGDDGQILSVDGTTPQKVAWRDAPRLSRSTFGMLIGSHEHPLRKQTTVHLRSADAIEMETGELVTGWSNLTANLLSSGANGLDSVSALSANTWYEVYAIWNPDTNAKALLLHRMKQRVLDQAWPGMLNEQDWPWRTATRVNYLRRSDTFLTAPFDRYLSKLSQSFVPSITAPLRAVDLVQSTVIPNFTFEGNVWLTIESDDGTGNATGAVLATSRSFSLREIDSSLHVGHYVFDTQATLTAGARYHIVMQGDWAINTATHSDANSIAFSGNTGPIVYPPNQQFWMASIGYSVPPATGTFDAHLGFGDGRTYNVVTSSWSVSANLSSGVGTGVTDFYFRTHMLRFDTSVSLPSGYTKKSLISYACTNGGSRLKEYLQVNRTMMMGYNEDWRVWSANNAFGATPIGLVDAKNTIPPVSCLVSFMVTCLADSVRLTPVLSYSKFISGNEFGPFRPLLPYGSVQQTTVTTPKLDLDDLQVFQAREVTTGNNVTYYVGSITF